MTKAVRAGAQVLPGWLVVLAAGVVVGVAMGRNQSMGLYLPPVTEALGVGREGFALAMATSQLLVGLGAPVAGLLIDRLGAARVIAACVLLTIAGLWCLYAVDSIATLLASGVLLGLGLSGTGITALVGPVGRLVPEERRLSAISAVGMAAGIGGFLALPLVHLLMDQVGWQASLLWLMAVIGLLLPASRPLAARPAATSSPGVRGQSAWAALAEAARLPSFWLLTSGFFVCGFHVAFVMVHLPAFTLDRGLPAWVGPAALSVVGIANIAGTFLVGQSGRYFTKRGVLCFIYSARAVVFLGFLFLPLTPGTTLALCTALGLLWLSTVPLTSALVATFFGTTWMSMLFGIVYLSHQLGSFVGVWLGGRLYDATGSYDAMWWAAAGLGVVSTLLHRPIQERPVARLVPVPAT